MIFKEIAVIQEEYNRLIKENKMTKKALCDLCVPFRDKYNLSDLETLNLARNQMTLSEIINLFERKGVITNDK